MYVICVPLNITVVQTCRRSTDETAAPSHLKEPVEEGLAFTVEMEYFRHVQQEGDLKADPEHTGGILHEELRTELDKRTVDTSHVLLPP